MANKIIPKRSSVSGKAPVAADLEVGEIAVNLTDRKIYTKDATNAVVQLGGGSGSGDVIGPATATDNAIARFDGATGKIVQNSGATLDDLGNAAFNGLALTNDLPITEGGTGASTAAAALSNLGGAPLVSPALTGTPTAPTAAAGTNTTQLATTAFVQAEIAADAPTIAQYNALAARVTALENIIANGTVRYDGKLAI